MLMLFEDEIFIYGQGEMSYQTTISLHNYIFNQVTEQLNNYLIAGISDLITVYCEKNDSEDYVVESLWRKFISETYENRFILRLLLKDNTFSNNLNLFPNCYIRNSIFTQNLLNALNIFLTYDFVKNDINLIKQLKNSKKILKLRLIHANNYDMSCYDKENNNILLSLCFIYD